jgi:hypothetical protein
MRPPTEAVPESPGPQHGPEQRPSQDRSVAARMKIISGLQTEMALLRVGNVQAVLKIGNELPKAFSRGRVRNLMQ